jgi:hypothetical protein
MLPMFHLTVIAITAQRLEAICIFDMRLPRRFAPRNDNIFINGCQFVAQAFMPGEIYLKCHTEV